MHVVWVEKLEKAISSWELSPYLGLINKNGQGIYDPVLSHHQGNLGLQLIGLGRQGDCKVKCRCSSVQPYILLAT